MRFATPHATHAATAPAACMLQRHNRSVTLSRQSQAGCIDTAACMLQRLAGPGASVHARRIALYTRGSCCTHTSKAASPRPPPATLPCPLTSACCCCWPLVAGAASPSVQSAPPTHVGSMAVRGALAARCSPASVACAARSVLLRGGARTPVRMCVRAAITRNNSARAAGRPAPSLASPPPPPFIGTARSRPRAARTAAWLGPRRRAAPRCCCLRAQSGLQTRPRCRQT